MSLPQKHGFAALRGRGTVRGALRSGAFSLIEVTLAIMVVTVGILSIMTLFGTGLEQNARSTDQTYATLFAEEVMSGMRAMADYGWPFLSSSATLPMAFKNKWNPPPSDVVADGLIHTNMLRRSDNTNILQASYRYRLTITTNQDDSAKGVTLEVWNSHFGNISISNALIYYTEVFNTLR